MQPFLTRRQPEPNLPLPIWLIRPPTSPWAMNSLETLLTKNDCTVDVIGGRHCDAN